MYTNIFIKRMLTGSHHRILGLKRHFLHSYSLTLLLIFQMRLTLGIIYIMDWDCTIRGRPGATASPLPAYPSRPPSQRFGRSPIPRCVKPLPPLVDPAEATNLAIPALAAILGNNINNLRNLLTRSQPTGVAVAPLLHGLIPPILANLSPTPP